MSLEKSILKSDVAATLVYDYKPKEFAKGITTEAADYVHDAEIRKMDFQISELVAQQSGVSKLEEERNRGLINDQVLEKLKEVQEGAYKEAYELGHQEGTAKALADEKDHLQKKLKELDQLLLSIESLKQDLLKQNEAQLVELAFQIAKKIALRDISQNKDAMVELFNNVISDLHAEQKIVVHVNNEDLAVLEELAKRVELTNEAIKKMKIIEDASVEHGGCLIDLEYGQVNATVADRVERVWEALEKQLQVIQKRAP